MMWWSDAVLKSHVRKDETTDGNVAIIVMPRNAYHNIVIPRQ